MRGKRVSANYQSGPDVVTDRYVIEVKNTLGEVVRGNHIEQAREHAKLDKRGRDWLLWCSTPGSPRYTVTLEHEHFLELLRMAGVLD